MGGIVTNRSCPETGLAVTKFFEFKVTAGHGVALLSYRHGLIWL